MSNAPTIVILAAGLGSRYGGLKQIEPIGPGGEAVLDYAVYDAHRAGFGKFVFVIRKDIEKDFRAAITHRFEEHVDVHFAFQELEMIPPGYTLPTERKKPWGTGHATLCAAPQVTEPFAVINADDFYGAESYQLLAHLLRQAPPSNGPDPYAMVGFQLDHTLSEHGTVARGICETDAEGALLRVEELTAIRRQPEGIANQEGNGVLRPLTGQEIVSLNFWGFRPSLFAHLDRLFAAFLEQNRNSPKAEFYLPVAVNSLIQEGTARVQVLRTPCHWFGVTYREDRPIVMQNIRALADAGAYPPALWT